MWVRHVEHANEGKFTRVILEINTLGSPSWRNVEVDPTYSKSNFIEGCLERRQY